MKKCSDNCYTQDETILVGHNRNILLIATIWTTLRLDPSITMEFHNTFSYPYKFGDVSEAATNKS